MQFLTSLVGGSANLYLNAALALGIVLALIVLGLWVLKLVFRASTGVVLGRNRRLAVVDSLPVDGKRQLLIVRRDNVEHLLLVGGQQDVVVESGFTAELQPAAPRPVPTMRRAAVAGVARTAALKRAAADSPKRAAAAEPPEAQDPGPTASLTPPLPSNDHEPVRASLERLRDYARTPLQRRPASIRHTGLMRPLGRIEPALVPANTDNSVQSLADSATRMRAEALDPEEGDGQAFGRLSDPDKQRDEGY
jgi:flagellar biogenesis protein FliO